MQVNKKVNKLQIEGFTSLHVKVVQACPLCLKYDIWKAQSSAHYVHWPDKIMQYVEDSGEPRIKSQPSIHE